VSRLYRFLSENALVTLGLVIWGLTLVTWVTWRVFGDSPPDIPMGTATAFGAVFGLPAVLAGAWKAYRDWRGRGGDQ
jgi:hypothetical protein|tara:strand:- start:1475 stop:1705 length:231 start_codon:yes stop_codon:yes gene_type:complete